MIVLRNSLKNKRFISLSLSPSLLHETWFSEGDKQEKIGIRYIFTLETSCNFVHFPVTQSIIRKLYSLCFHRENETAHFNCKKLFLRKMCLIHFGKKTCVRFLSEYNNVCCLETEKILGINIRTIFQSLNPNFRQGLKKNPKF